MMVECFELELMLECFELEFMLECFEFKFMVIFLNPFYKGVSSLFVHNFVENSN